MTNYDKINALFVKKGGIIKTADFVSAGIHKKYINQLIDSGIISKIKHGYYQWVKEEEFNEIYLISKLFPDGILCMDTALFHYRYSDRTPSEWHIAVNKDGSKSRFDIDYPFVKPYYIEPKYLGIGLSHEVIDNCQIKIYDRERVTCDCLRYMNKMDKETFNKAIQAYLADPQKNMKNLAEYAKQLRVYKKVQNVIGVWL